MSNTENQWLAIRSSGESAMGRLFNRLDGMYPGQWKNKFSDETQINNWALTWSEAFDDEGITPEEIAVGIKVCRSRQIYPPSLPEFLQCCRQPIDYDKAFYEAVLQMGRRKRCVVKVEGDEVIQYFEQDTWSHPAIYWAAVGMGVDLNQQYRFVEKRWHHELDTVLRDGKVKPVPMNTNLIQDKSSHAKELTAEEKENISKAFNLAAMFDEPKEEKPITDQAALGRKALELAKQRLEKGE